MIITQVSPSVIQVRMKYKKDFEQSFLMSSDHHIDNPKADRNLIRKVFKEAKERDAKHLMFGDIFCAMQGKYDKRSSKSDIRPEHNNGNYLDSLVNTTADFFEPYKDDIVLITPGNHETSIQRKHETNLTKRLAERIDTNVGTYSGYVQFIFEHESGGGIRRVTLFYTHGYGGGGPVTKGVIQSNRKACYVVDADIVVSGHIHDEWILTIMQERINHEGTLKLKKTKHVSLATFKEEYLQHKGWHIERGAPPKPLGACWLRFYTKGNEVKFELVQTD